MGVRVLIVAAEASADAYGARVVEALRALEPGVELAGMGGERLGRAGLARFAPARALAIVGFTRVFVRLPQVLRLYRRMLRELREHRPDVLLCIDLPEFSMLLARRARRLGIPTLFFMGPQLWAWRSGRVRRLAACASKVVVGLPFERAHYERAGIPVAYHGHPLREHATAAFANREKAAAHFGLDPARPVVILAPGSRRAEWRHHHRPLFDAAARIARERPDVQLALPRAPHVRPDEIEAAARHAGVDVCVAETHTHDLLALGELGLLCSGSITLEAALAGLPMLIFYKVNWLNAWLARRMLAIDRIGLPNIVLGGDAPVFPELLQRQVTGPALAAQALALLGSPDAISRLRAGTQAAAAQLEGGETTAQVARETLALAGVGHAPHERTAPPDVR